MKSAKPELIWGLRETGHAWRVPFQDKGLLLKEKSDFESRMAFATAP